MIKILVHGLVLQIMLPPQICCNPSVCFLFFLSFFAFLSFSVVVPSQVQNIITFLNSVHVSYHYNRWYCTDIYITSGTFTIVDIRC